VDEEGAGGPDIRSSNCANYWSPRVIDADAHLPAGWWAHFEFTRKKIEPTILCKQFEDVREAGVTLANPAAFSQPALRRSATRRATAAGNRVSIHAQDLPLFAREAGRQKRDVSFLAASELGGGARAVRVVTSGPIDSGTRDSSR
jgi:hypothetical protein